MNDVTAIQMESMSAWLIVFAVSIAAMKQGHKTAGSLQSLACNAKTPQQAVIVCSKNETVFFLHTTKPSYIFIVILHPLI